MDISLKVIADKFGKSLDALADSVEVELQEAVKNVATQAYGHAIAQVQAMKAGDYHKKAYLKGLNLQALGDDSYLISLEGDWANKLEGGIAPYDMKEILLASKKIVGVGSRAGEPWVQISQEGNRYAHVPFQHRPFSANKLTGNLESDILKMTAMNAKGRQQKITKLFKDEFGNPLSGKVAKARSDNPQLDNLVKYQHIYESGKVQSIYMTFRTISDASSGWQNPGVPAFAIFKELEDYVEAELANIVKVLL